MRMEDRIGSLEPGKRADVVVVAADGLHQWPQEVVANPYSFLVYSTKASDVETVIVHGKLVVRNGRVQTLDASEVRAKTAELRARVSVEKVARER